MRGRLWKDGDEVKAEGVFVIACGCGGVAETAKKYLKQAGYRDVPVFQTSTDKLIKAYMERVGLKIMISELKHPKHNIILNVETGQYLNLLGAKKNPNLNDNIRKVVEG